MMRTYQLIILFVSLSILKVNAQSYTVTPILVNGNPETTYNLVILAEAYTQSQLNDFIAQANLVDDVLSLNPVYDANIDDMNIYAISTPSVDGAISLIANNPSPYDPIQTTEQKNTFFGVYYANSYRAYALDDSLLVKARRVAAEHVPFVDNVLILVNTSQGQPSSGRASFDKVAVVGAAPNFSVTSEKHTLVHELAHSVAGLSDTYSDYKEEGFNKTGNNDPATIRWSNMLSNPDVGIEYIYPGVYYPNSNCLMRESSSAYFCPVCEHRINNVLGINKADKIPTVHRMYQVSEDLNQSIFEFGWDTIAGAEYYEVVYNKADFSTGEITTYSKTVTTNQVMFDLPGTTASNYVHDLLIRAYNSNTSTHFSEHFVPFMESYSPVVFQVPSNITVSDITNTSFKVEWNTNINSQVSLIRLWNGNNVFSEVLTELGEITFYNLEDGGQYEIEIAAVYPVDESLNNSSPFSQRIPVSLSPLGITDNEPSSELYISNNPVSTYIQIEGVIKSSEYVIYNQNGQSVQKGMVKEGSKSIINVSTLAKGSYVLRINNRRSLKFIKS